MKTKKQQVNEAWEKCNEAREKYWKLKEEIEG